MTGVKNLGCITSFIDLWMKQLSFKSCSLTNKPHVVKLLHQVVKGKSGETDKARVTTTVATIFRFLITGV